MAKQDEKESEAPQSEIESEAAFLDGHNSTVRKTIESLDLIVEASNVMNTDKKFLIMNTKMTCITLMLCSIDRRLAQIADKK